MTEQIKENLLVKNEDSPKKKRTNSEEEDNNDELAGFKNDPEETVIERIISDAKYDKSIKIVLIGDAGVGKTSIITRLLHNKFDESVQATLNPDYYNYTLKVNDYVIRMQIWDTAGQEKYNSIISNHYRSAEAAIFVYSIGNKSSYDNLKEWYKQLTDVQSDENTNVKKILLGNKKDLENEREVEEKDAENFAKEFGFQIFAEVTSKCDENQKIFKISHIFDSIAKLFYDDYCSSKADTGNNSSSYNYVASNSILEGKKKKVNKSQEEVKKSGCCC